MRFRGPVVLPAAVLACVAGVVPAAATPPASGGTWHPRPVVVSTAADGTPADGESRDAVVSGNGRFVAFVSDAGNLVPGDTNGLADVFVKDLRTGAVDRADVADDGSQADAAASHVSVSADGRYVAFDSYAGNLAPGDTPGAWDVFVHDRATGRTEAVVPRPGGDPGNSYDPVISANGRHVAYASYRDDLVPQDTNSGIDVFVHDRARGTTRLASVFTDHIGGTSTSLAPTISADGSRIGFRRMWYPPRGTAARAPRGPRPWWFYVHDTRTGKTVPAAVDREGNTLNMPASPTTGLGPDGRYAVFSSPSADVVDGDTNDAADVFVRDLTTGTTRRVSTAADGAQAHDGSGRGRLSAGARRVFFTSAADNLVPGDTNGARDVFAKDLRTGVVRRLDVAADGTESPTGTEEVTTDTTGRTAVFPHDDGLVPGDANGHRDILALRLPPSLEAADR
ncbi:hypothetical protein [Streptomyces sp. NPDC049590]|uniref:hypothetical protein n=1 Tax=Streptomyces sp. NPDC049590 TaxID=3154834 RepID=UPI0034445BA0